MSTTIAGSATSPARPHILRTSVVAYGRLQGYCVLPMGEPEEFEDIFGAARIMPEACGNLLEPGAA